MSEVGNPGINEISNELQSKNIDYNDINTLLENFKNGKEISKKSFKELDNNESLSKTEEKLYEKYITLKDKSSAINFLSEIVNKLQEKKNNSNNSTIKDMPSLSINIIGNKINKLNNITGKYDSIKDLLNNKNDRRSILEIDLTGMCTDLRFKNSSESLENIREEIINKEKEDIKTLLEDYTNKEGKTIDEIFQGDSCEPFNLINKLKGLKDKNGKTLKEKEITNILKGVSISKKVISEDKFNNLLDKNGLEKKDLLNEKGNLKSSKELKEILKNKKVNNNEINKIRKGLLNSGKIIAIQKIIKESNNLKEIEEKIKKMEKIISSGNNNYNNYSNEYFLENKKQIININNKKRLLEVIKDLKGQNNKENLDFFNITNPSMRGDFDVLQEFYKLNNKKINILNISQINFDKLEKKEKIDFLGMLNPEALDIQLIKNQTYIQKVEGYSKYKNILKKILKINDLSTDLDIETDINKIDNSILDLFKKNIGTENILDILYMSDFGDGKDSITLFKNLPKTFNYIINNDEIINFLLDDNFFFYNYLPLEKQKEHSIEYVKSILDSGNENKLSELVLMQFKDKESMFTIFKLLKEKSKIYNKNIIQDLLKRPLFRTNYLDFRKNNNIEIDKLTDDEKNTIGKIQEEVNFYMENTKKYKKEFEKSELNKTLNQNKNSGVIKNLYNDEKFIEKLVKKPDIAGPIVGVCRGILEDKYSKGESLNGYISQIANNFDSVEDFTEVLNDIDKAVKKAFIKAEKDIESIKLKEKTKERLKNINTNYLQNNGENIKLDGIEKDFNTFLVLKQNELKKDFSVNDNEKYIKEFLEKKGLNNLSPEWKDNISNYLKNSKNTKTFQSFVKEVKKNPNLIEKIKSGKFSYKNFSQKEFVKTVKENEKKQEESKEQNKTDNEKINDRNIINTAYNIDINKLPSEITENNTIILKNGKSIDNISSEEYKQLKIKNGKVGNPEALKNLIDMEEKLDKLGLEFVWKNKESIFKIMKNDSEFKTSGINENDNKLIDKREFNLLLQFILKIYGEKNPSTIESINYSTILQINNIGSISDKKDSITGLSNIGMKFIEIGYFNSSGGIDIFGENNLRKYVKNGYKKPEKK